MKRKYILLLLLILSFSFLFGQVDTLWTRTYGGNADDHGHSIEQTNDGGYIIAGYSQSHKLSPKNFWILKTDALGDTIWTKTYGGEGDDIGYSIIQTKDEGYAIVGSTYSFGFNIWLIKIDIYGNTEWTKTFDYGATEGYSIIQTSDNGYAIVGYSDTGRNVLFIKTDSTGNIEWSKTYGGFDKDVGYSIIQTNDNGYAITGYTKSYGSGWQDVLFIKTDSTGNTEWIKTYGGSNHDMGRSIIQTDDNGYAIIGYTESYGLNPGDVLFIKIDSTGNTEWTKTYGGSSHEMGYSIKQVNDNGYIIVGQTYSYGSGGDLWILKTDALGDTIWTKTYGGINTSELGYSVIQTKDYGYAITGYIEYSTGTSDLIIIKTDVERPLSPQNIVITQNNKYVKLTWNENNISDIEKYFIYKDIQSPATTLIDSVEGNLPVQEYTDVNVENGTSYYYRIKSVNSFGVKSDFSEEVMGHPDVPPTWSIPDTSLTEDIPLTLDLDDYLYDQYDDNSTLDIVVEAGDKITSTFNSDNHILTLTPDKDLSDYTESIIATATDPWGFSSYDTFDVYISAVNDAPMASNETINVFEEIPLQFTLSVSDVDNESSELVFTLLDSTINGKLTGALPDLTYLSEIDYNGLDSLKFSVSDGELSDTGKYIINVQAVNDLPLAYSYETTTYEDQTVQLLYDGEDIDGTFSFTVLNHPTHGILSGSIPNQIYTPNQNYFGTDQIGFLITDNDGGKDTGYINISIQSINDPPQPTFSESIINEGETKSITLTASPGASNESDQALTFILRTVPDIGDISETESGSAILQSELPITLADPNIFYSSSKKFTSTSFIYNVQDNGGTENGGIDTSLFQTVTISMNVETKMSLSTSGSIEGGVTILGDNTLYAPSSGDKVYRFDTTGTVMYSLNVDGNVKSSSTITSNHNVYIASTDYNLYSFNTNGVSNSGWPIALGAEATASVAIDASGNSYIGTGNGIFQCIASDGTINWSYNVGAAVYASAAISGENVLYVANSNGRVYAFDLNDLNPSSISPLWTYEIGEAVSSSPALDIDSSLYITTESGSIIKLSDNGSSASESWNIDTEQKYVGSPVISSNGYLYIGGEAKILYALDITDGSIVWQDTLSGKIKSTVSLNEQGTDEDRVYVGDDTGRLYAVKKLTGEIIWQYQADDAINCPILYADDHVYFGTMGGDIISIEDKFSAIAMEKQSSILIPIWPTFQGNNQRTGAQTLAIPAVSTVYPGDTNNDGIVDALDVLPIGVYFLEEGTSRASASNIWEGQDVTSWPSYPANYADCNGDGVVDEKDIIGVGVNWGSSRTNSINKFMINQNDKQMLAKHKDAFETIYNSVDDLESVPAKAIKQLLETTLEIVPETITLYQCYPNPFNPSTEIRFSLPEATSVSLKVFDINGRHITTLVNSTELGSGYHNITFNGEAYSSGMYIYVLETENTINAQKMMLIK